MTETDETWSFGLMPFDEDAEHMPEGAPISFGPPGTFAYIGQALTLDEFTAYVASYDFGTIPPSYVVLHHTAVPSASWARYSSGAVWDADEAGFTAEQKRAKRLRQVTAIKDYYQNTHGWQAGPHLFIDDLFIYLFTPMRTVGIHAKEGNAYTDNRGLHYSIGIEVIGYYERTKWPAPVERLVGHSVALLKRRLGNFELRYQKWGGGISSHRDYNKPQCPGAAITESYYIEVLKRAWDQLGSPATPAGPKVTPASAKVTPAGSGTPLTVEAPLLGPPSGSLEQAVAFVQARLPADSEYAKDVGTIMGYYWTHAPTVGLDPFLAAAQCVMETGGLTSHWAGRPRRNPAGLGVHQEGGYSFASWDESVQAHLGQLLALALRDDEANEAQRQMMSKNPRHGLLAAELRGTAHTLAALGPGWANDPTYGEKVVRRANAMLGLSQA